MKPTTPTRSLIPCYAADGTSLGYRTLAAAQRLVAGGYVQPAYGRKGHLKAIWLLQEDGGNPVQPHAPTGTRYSYIETLDTGRCWQLRRLDRHDADGAPANIRGQFFQVVRECMAAPSSVALDTTQPTVSPVPTATPAPAKLPASTPAPCHASDHRASDHHANYDARATVSSRDCRSGALSLSRMQGQ